MSLARTIDEAWEARDTLSVDTKGIVRDAVETVLAELDAGKLRVAEKLNGEWLVHQWLKKAVLLSFRLNGMKLIAGAPVGVKRNSKPPAFAPFRAAWYASLPLSPRASS
jgi:2,3,4,5-tetrahydropyridine-2,6-dicarboxylate N-succinyltransferase